MGFLCTLNKIHILHTSTFCPVLMEDISSFRKSDMPFCTSKQFKKVGVALITKLITKLVHSQKAKCRITSLSDTYYTGWDNKSGSVDEHFFDKFIS